MSARAFGPSVCLLAGVSALALGLACPGFARAADAGADAGSALEEIIVTAERREQRLQDVPIAVTAVTAQRLEAAGITGSEGLTQVTPGLNMTRIRQSSSPFIRGVGTLTATAGFESPVATYVDGVYMPSMPGGFFSFNNIARIEVLKGPQGTLFGRNALGGVVQVITKDPGQTPEGDFEIGYGNYDTLTGQLYLAHPLNDRLSADLSLNYSNQGQGWGRNLVTGNGVDFTREFNARTKLVFDSGPTRVEAALDYSSVTAATGLAATIYPGSIGTGNVVAPPDFYDVKLSTDPYSHYEQLGAMVTWTQDLGFANFVSISNARRVRNWFNLTGYLPVNVSDIKVAEDNKSWSQEFQLQSNSEGRLEWTLGVYTFNMHAEFDPLRVTGSSVAALGGYEARYPRTNTTSLAGFGQATYNITDTTRLTVGLRYTHDKQKIKAQYFRPIVAGPAVSIGPKSATFGKPTWRIGLDHKLTPNVLIYASYNRGFKAGTFSASAPLDDAVQPEVIDAFEIGEKADLFNGVLRLNTSAYYYDYSNIQLTSISGTPPLAHLLNAAKGKLYGVEIDAELAPTRNLTIRGAVSLAHAEYDEFTAGPLYVPRVGGGNTTVFVNLSGKDIVFTPKWTASINADYTIPLSTGEIGLNASLYHSDGYFFVPSNRLKQGPFTVVNSSLSWKSNRGYRVEVWGKNLFGEKYWTYGSEAAATDTVVAAEPRTFGIALGYAF